MPFRITPSVHVETDSDGLVRSLHHTDQPYRAEPGISDPRVLADAYVRDVAKIYEFPETLLAGLDKDPTSDVTDAPTELRFRQTTTAPGAVTINYQQTHFGLPIWEAGLSVHILLYPLRVVSSQSALRKEIEIAKPDTGSEFMPARITSTSVAGLFGEDRGRAEYAIQVKRLWIYRYDDRQRIISSRQSEPPSRLKGEPIDKTPTLPMGSAPDRIRDGHYYVVTEILFGHSLPEWPGLNWRALVEVETSTVLYLRALVTSCTGSVYLTDPPTATGDGTITACSPTATLNPLRTKVSLQGLTPASPAALAGAYVTVTDNSTPLKNPPTTALPPGDFTYDVPTDNFAAVNAYHHIDESFRLIESQGFSPITGFFTGTTFPVPVYFFDETVVNAHFWPNATNNGIGRFTFGFEQTGCPVGIVVDWRVVWHEFVHGMLQDRIHSFLLGFAHNGGDSYGAIYMDPGSQASDRFLIFPWVPDIPRRMDRAVDQGWAWGGAWDDRGYQSEEILATTLFRLYRSTGGDSSNRANRLLASRYILAVMTHAMATLPLATTTPTTAVSYAAALTNADAAISSFQGVAGGGIGKVVRWSFEKQGLYQPPGAPTPVTIPGDPPAVDVFIDDGRNGEYTPAAPYVDNFVGTRDIWNRRASDNGLANQNPLPYVTNYLYVRVKNRGTTPANNTVAYGYQAPGLYRGSNWPNDFEPLTTDHLAAAIPIPSGGSIIIGPFDWTPIEGRNSLLISVSATGDPSNIDPASTLPCLMGPIPTFRLVPLDNNIAQRNIWAIKPKEDKEPKEIKEFKEFKEPKEVKEYMEKEKDYKEKDKDVYEGFSGPPRIDPESFRVLLERVESLERQMARGRAFIGPEERPQVGRKALGARGKKKE